MALAAGATICIAPFNQVAADLGETIRLFDATHVCTTPALWATLTDRPAEVPSLRRVVLGGDFTPSSLISKWSAAVELYNAYGTTEATVHQFVNRIGAPAANPVSSKTAAGSLSLHAPTSTFGSACHNTDTINRSSSNHYHQQKQ